MDFNQNNTPFQPYSVFNNTQNQPEQPVEQSVEQPAESVENVEKPAVEAKKHVNKEAKPTKDDDAPRLNKETVGAIIELDNMLGNDEDSGTLTFVRFALGLSQNSTRRVVILELLKKGRKAELAHFLTTQLNLLNDLSDPFKAALTISLMPDNTRRRVWDLLTLMYPEEVGNALGGKQTKNGIRLAGDAQAQITTLYKAFVVAQNLDYGDKLMEISSKLEVIK